MHDRRVDTGPRTRLDPARQRFGGQGRGRGRGHGLGPSAGNEGRSEFLFSSAIGPIASEPVELGGTWAEAADAGGCAGDISAGDVLAGAGRSGGSIVTRAGARRARIPERTKWRAGCGLGVGGRRVLSRLRGWVRDFQSRRQPTGRGGSEVTGGADGNGGVRVPDAICCRSLSVPFAWSGCSGMRTGVGPAGRRMRLPGWRFLPPAAACPEGGILPFWRTSDRDQEQEREAAPRSRSGPRG